MSQTPPVGLDPNRTEPRTVVIEADAQTLQRMLKEGHSRQFTVISDEGPRLGGGDTAPTPLQYFLLGLGF
jgi:uncharacterized OsmC-like protein